jgi:hypothetical protein
MRALIFLFALFLLPLDSRANELLKKQDVTRYFSLSFTEWSVLLKESHELGDAQVAVNDTYNWTRLSLVSIGILKVTPEYSPGHLHRPKRVRVSVRENEARSKKTLQLTDEQLLSMISLFQKEMLPEYSATTTIDLVKGYSQFHFILYKVGEYPQMDRVAIETKGCWQRCIRR